ncbi:HAMP domain-containing histidine kinase [bacterium]|nr:HAMP domain-containing histidine kinase [bacterium]
MKRPLRQIFEGQSRQFRLIAWTLFALLMLGTLLMWKRSIDYVSERRHRESEESSKSVIQGLTAFFDERLLALRRISQFCLYTEDLGAAGPALGETEPGRTDPRRLAFENFCQELFDEVPGILAVIMTDRDGIPQWVAPHDRIPRETANLIAADQALTREFSQYPSSHLVTGPMTFVGHGDGFVIAVPIMRGHRVHGHILGVFLYQGLFDKVVQKGLTRNFNIRIVHEDRVVYPLLPKGASVPAGPGAERDRELSIRQPVFTEGWQVVVEPTTASVALPLNPFSLGVLCIGMLVSIAISRLFYRWVLRAAQWQTEAKESRSRLEHTGMSLMEVHSQLELIVNSIDEGVVFYDSSRKPVMANAAFQAMFNMGGNPRLMSSAAAHHEHMIQALGSESKYWSLFEALRRWPEQQYTDEISPPGQEGRRKPRAYTRRAMNAADAAGEHHGTIVVYKDVSRDKAIDRAKDEFLANVTHELRSPLSSIKGFAEMMRRDPKMAEERRGEFVSIICEEADRLQQLVEELLDLRRIEDQGMPFNPTTFDLKALVEELVAGARAILMTKNLTMTVEWTGVSDNRMQGDVTQFRRAVRNLLVNSAKYSPESGKIKIIGHSGRERLTLDIHDQGSGIDDRDLPHIFEKFYRGVRQGKQKGTGLGLAIVKHIIERHGGHIGVRSEMGEGTTFRIEMPRHLVVPVEPVDGTPPQPENDQAAQVQEPKEANDGIS